MGMTEGHIIGVALPNSLSFVPTFLALTQLAATTALISVKYSRNELLAICEGIRPQGVITTESNVSTVQAVSEIIDIRKIEGFFRPETLCLVKLRSEDRKVPVADAALIKFSSGSTGEPKGIPLTAANIRAECENVIGTLSISERDIIYASVPLYHSYGFDLGVLASLAGGASLVIRDSFVPRLAMKEFRSEKVTIFLGIPVMYRFLADQQLSFKPDFSTLRYLLSCTAPLSSSLIAAFYDRFHVPICQHYGSSETGAITTHRPEEVLKRINSVGIPMKNVLVTIRDDDGHEVTRGTEGEVAVQSEAMAHRYLMGAPSGRSPFQNGYFRTGDRGSLDQDGFLFLHGRSDDMINVGGLKVSPHEVTQVLERHPSVREAAVVGAKNPMGEEVVYAIVSLRAAVTEAKLLEFCREHLADYKIPRRIDIREELPRGASSKIKIRPEDILP